MTFVVANRKLEQLPQWVKVSEVFRSTGDAAFLKRAGVHNFDDDRYVKYTRRHERLRGVRAYTYLPPFITKSGLEPFEAQCIPTSEEFTRGRQLQGIS
jgi:hypothetical protein